ncbi:MAG: hypothetical protein KY469_04190, partial [Actinobacteria bacterium]|nr:hypothetical protein [Actinomycetota bacterium]
MPTPSAAPDATHDPAGSVSVAYPEEPAAWYPAFFDDPAAVDLAVLWGVPLFHLDEHGQLRPALARSWTEADDAEG